MPSAQIPVLIYLCLVVLSFCLLSDNNFPQEGHQTLAGCTYDLFEVTFPQVSCLHYNSGVPHIPLYGWVHLYPY